MVRVPGQALRQVVVGPASELSRCLSSDRLPGTLLDDPLIHFYRSVPWATHAVNQPKTLCGRRVMLGRHSVPADTGVCILCRWHARRQTGVGR